MTSTPRRPLLGWLAAGLASAVLPPARAQAYPSRPVKVLVGFPPGGAVDIIARTVSQQVGRGLGQSFVIENKPGAGTNIALRALIDSPPDGHTLMLVANSIAANPSLYQPPPYDLARDFSPIALVGRVPVVIVVSTTGPYDSVAGLIAKARTGAGAVQYASPGNGSTPHLAIELFARAAGVQLTHIPYKGGAPALNDLLAGHIQAVGVNALEAQPHVRSGKLKVLAALSPGRTPIYPEAPTIAESGFPGFEASVWYGLVGPAGLPAAVVSRLHAEVQKALAVPEVRDRLTASGGEVMLGSTERFSTLLASERTRYDKLIREARIQPD